MKVLGIVFVPKYVIQINTSLDFETVSEFASISVGMSLSSCCLSTLDVGTFHPSL